MSGTFRFKCRNEIIIVRVFPLTLAGRWRQSRNRSSGCAKFPEGEENMKENQASKLKSLISRSAVAVVVGLVCLQVGSASEGWGGESCSAFNVSVTIQEPSSPVYGEECPYSGSWPYETCVKAITFTSQQYGRKQFRFTWCCQAGCACSGALRYDEETQSIGVGIGCD